MRSMFIDESPETCWTETTFTSGDAHQSDETSFQTIVRRARIDNASESFFEIGLKTTPSLPTEIRLENHVRQGRPEFSGDPSRSTRFRTFSSKIHWTWIAHGGTTTPETPSRQRAHDHECTRFDLVHAEPDHQFSANRVHQKWLDLDMVSIFALETRRYLDARCFHWLTVLISFQHTEQYDDKRL